MRVNSTAPEGCGTDEREGSCFSCIVRRVRWSLKQLLPLKYHTVYRTGDEMYLNDETWRMWFGRVFAHQRHTYFAGGTRISFLSGGAV